MQQSIASRLRSLVLHIAVSFAAGTVILAYYTCLSCARIQHNIRQACSKAVSAARWQIDRLWAELVPGITQAAIVLIVGTVVFTFYVVLYGARFMLVLRARFHGLTAFLRRAEPALKGALAAMLPRLRLSPGSLGLFSQMMLFGAVLILVVLPPTQAKAPLPIQALSMNKAITPTPFRPVSQTPTIIPTVMPTATITSTPAVHITAVAQLPGPGNCGIVDGSAGTGQYAWPAVEHSLSGYNYRPRSGHLGIDIAGSTGDNIYAADSGAVVYSGWNNQGYGNLVILDHGNGYQTVYAHLSKLLVQCAARVNQGETIGLMGSTGWSTGSHLHFEIMTNQMEHVNPWLYLEK